MRSAAAGELYADCTTPASSMASWMTESRPSCMRLSTVSIDRPSTCPATMSPASTGLPVEQDRVAAREAFARRRQSLTEWMPMRCSSAWRFSPIAASTVRFVPFSVKVRSLLRS